MAVFMAVMVKILTEQNKAMAERMKTVTDKNDFPGPSNLTKSPAEIQEQS